jgi:hypothetical protein
MSPFDRDTSNRLDSPGGTPRDPSGAQGSSSDAEDSAAHIAELVRRTAERDARPGPSSVAPTSRTVAQPPMTFPPVAQSPAPQVAQSPGPPVTRRSGPEVSRSSAPPLRQRVAHLVSERTSHWALPEVRQPPVWALVAGGAVAVVLIASGFALSQPETPAVTPAAAPTVGATAAPAYDVKASDVITDCASHSRLRTRTSFQDHNCVKATRTLATGLVGGRKTLFVVSRIEMGSADEATSIKRVLDASGTGNLNDLLREGKFFAGGPRTMPRSGYASVLRDDVVVVSEAGFIDGGSSSSANPALRTAAMQMASRQLAGG